MKFSAVLLAGGKSSRMGRDKTLLTVNGVPLWRRQFAMLQATGAEEVYISGRPNGPWEGVECVPDEVSDAGPMAGIAAALHRSASPWLLVLAVDMPDMTAGFLRGLVSFAESIKTGVVPVREGRLEPLAAIYPQWSASVASALLHGGHLRLDGFVSKLEELEGIERYIVTAKEAPLFANWNEPGDVTPWS